MQIHDFQKYAIKPDFDRRYIEGLSRRFRELVDQGKTLYFVSLTYVESKEFPLTASYANSHLTRVYTALLRYLCGSSRYDSHAFRSLQPQMYAFMDVSGSKQKTDMRVPKHESSYHHHCILAADGSLVDDLDLLSNEKVAMLFAQANKQKTGLRTIDVQKINIAEIEKVVDYASYWSRKRLYSETALQIFPTANSERAVA